jgi:hypothetical protein
MQKRSRVPKKQNKKLFSRTADRTHGFNLMSRHQTAAQLTTRGGIRL